MSDSVIRLVVESGPFAQTVLLLLLFFSVFSWAIVGQKVADFRRAAEQSAAFLELFRSGAEHGQVYRQCKPMRGSPVCGLFCSAHEFLSGYAKRQGVWRGQREDLWKLLDGMVGEQVARMERHLGFLATVANVSPFIGLLGTVWGIMDAFRSIGLEGSANLAVVAPGIAAALIATAAGLGAAIPAVMAYNYFLARADAVQREVERFAAELAAVLAGEGQG